MNEVFLWSGKGARISSQVDTIYTQNVQKFAVKLDSVIRAEDANRHSAMAMHMGSDYERYNIEGIAQAVGFNVYSGWYGGTFDGFGRSFDRRHERNPDQIIFISEYGAGSDLRLNSTEPKRLDFTGQYQRMYHESYLRQINARPYLVGTAIWSQFDFSQPHTGGSIPHLNQKGMLTWDRQAKDVYYLYKANWNKEPMVYIATRDWLHRAGADSTNGEKTVSFDLVVYTNLDKVKLSVNGKSLGTKKPNDIKAITWNVPLKDGNNILMATGKKGTLTIEDRVVVRLDRYSTDLRNGEEPFTHLTVNVGSNAQFRDDSGVIWVEDRAYSEGSFGYIEGTPTFFPRKKIIRGTAQEALYYTYRDSLSGYKFDVPEGNYEVELHFIEPEVYKPGERVFDISVNDRTIINDFDLYGEAGFGWAINKSFNVSVDGEEGIDIKFNQQEGTPLLSGIKVIKKI
jgi:beta-galactosidase